MTTATSLPPTHTGRRLGAYSALVVALAMLATLIVSTPASAASRNFWAEGCYFNVQAVEHFGSPRGIVKDNNSLCGQLKLRMHWSNGEYATPWMDREQIIVDATGDQCKARGAVVAPSGQAYVSSYVVHDLSNC